MAFCAPTGAIGGLGIILNSANFRPGHPVSLVDSRPDSETHHDRTYPHLPDLPNANQVDGIAGRSADRRHPEALRGSPTCRQTSTVAQNDDAAVSRS
jgi:hypothetical protein